MKSLLKKQRLLAVVVGVCLGSASFGQRPDSSPSQKPAEGDVVRITTNLVQVDAVITDKSGKGSATWGLRPRLYAAVRFADSASKRTDVVQLKRIALTNAGLTICVTRLVEVSDAGV